MGQKDKFTKKFSSLEDLAILKLDKDVKNETVKSNKKEEDDKKHIKEFLVI